MFSRGFYRGLQGERPTNNSNSELQGFYEDLIKPILG